MEEKNKDIVPVNEELETSGNEAETLKAIEGNNEFFHEVRHPKKRMFLAAYCEYGTITKAAQVAGIDRGTHYHWMEDDEEYPAWFEKAEQLASEKIEAEIKRRAIDGILKPVFYQGKIVGHVKEYSDNLLMFYAKAAMPEKYMDRVRNEIVPHPLSTGGEQVNTLKQLKEQASKDKEK